MGMTGLTAAPAPMGPCTQGQWSSGMLGLACIPGSLQRARGTYRISPLALALCSSKTEAQTKCHEQLLSMVPLANLI